jgi:hypothetical protein
MRQAYIPASLQDIAFTHGRTVIMRCLRPLVLVCALVAGCLSTRSDVNVSNYEQGEGTPASGDAVGIDLYVAVAERPVGDRYLNRGLWEFADEQTPFEHDLDRKSQIDQNGFRVGLLGGTPDGPFQNLLSGRNCPDPRCVRILAGNPTSIQVGGVWSSCSFQLVRKGREEPVELQQAECRLQVLPHLDGENKVRLEITPMVRHGDQQKMPRAVQDPDGSRRWDVQVRRPEEVYGWMSWTLSLAPGDYAIIGGHMDRPESLGRRMFLFTQAEAPVQRVVVLRAMRSGGPTANKKREGPQPLAARALEPIPTTGSRVRGVPPQ